jgi:hypothetical protein
VQSASGFGILQAELGGARLNGGRAWWAHLEFARINIAPTILHKIEDWHDCDTRGLSEPHTHNRGVDIHGKEADEHRCKTRRAHLRVPGVISQIV